MNQEYKKLASMAVSKLKVILFLGSVREGRLGLRVARFMQNYLENTGHEVDLFGKNPRLINLLMGLHE